MAGESQTLLDRLSTKKQTWDAEQLVRGAALSYVLRHGGAVFADSSGSSETFNHSAPVKFVDVFLSHCWNAGRWSKFLALSYHFNLRRGCAVVAFLTAGLLSVSVGVRLFGFPALLSPKVLQHFYLEGVVAAFFATLLLGHELPGKKPSAFLDKVCIHQSDENQKQAAIQHLGTFLQRSRCICVLYDRQYFTRLWCAYEVAYYAAKVDPDKVVVLPLWYAPFVLFGMLCNLLAYQIGFGWEFSSGLYVWEMVTLGPLAGTAVFWVIAYSPALLFVVATLRFKSREDSALRKQLTEFATSQLDCKVEADREFVLGCIHKYWAPEEPDHCGESVTGLSTRSGEAAFEDFVHEEFLDTLVKFTGGDKVCNYATVLVIFLPGILGGCVDTSTVTAELVQAQGCRSYFEYAVLNTDFYGLQVLTLYPVLLALTMKLTRRLGDASILSFIALYAFALALTFVGQVACYVASTNIGICPGARVMEGTLVGWCLHVVLVFPVLALYGPAILPKANDDPDELSV